MTFKYRYRKQILIITIILLLAGSLITYNVFNSKPKEKAKKKIVLASNKEEVKETTKKDSNNTTYKVDIKGYINNPNIYEVKEGSRVIDVINMAGGLKDNADTSVLNLSKKVFDEMVIIVYSNDEVVDFAKTKEVEEQVQEKCIQEDANALKNDACIKDSSSTTTNALVNINTASKEELMTISGIGEAKANNIISYRETNGNFKTIEDIKNVSGIGDSIFAQIKNHITI